MYPRITLSLLTIVMLLLSGCQLNCEKTARELEANKKLVADMYQELFGDKNIDAIQKYIADDYIQHNPFVADGKQALIDAAKNWFVNASKEKIDIQHIAADKDLVFIHLKSHMGAKTVSVIDIFRIKNGKIAEHWDVMQEVPEKAANKHPMF
jgi:predicted SnoaL-like aldol condensation-catalyzing enzyme